MDDTNHRVIVTYGRVWMESWWDMGLVGMVFVMLYFTVCMLDMKVFVYFFSLNYAYSLLYECYIYIKRKQIPRSTLPLLVTAFTQLKQKTGGFFYENGIRDGFFSEGFPAAGSRGILLKHKWCWDSQSNEAYILQARDWKIVLSAVQKERSNVASISKSLSHITLQ